MAVTDGRLASNPLQWVERPRVPRVEARHWTPDEARAFLEAQERDRLYPLWFFWLSTGLRPRELVPLRWSSVDLDAGRVVVRDFVTVVDYKVVASRGKTKHAHRVVDLDPVLTKLLRRHKATQTAEQVFAGAAYTLTDHVFVTPLGEPYHPEYLTRLVARLAKEAALPPIPAYGMRHTSAALLLHENVHDKVAAQRLGHSDVTLFLNTYSHATATMHVMRPRRSVAPWREDQERHDHRIDRPVSLTGLEAHCPCGHPAP
jgi:integrase